jgi:hypothetical protein
LHENSFSTIEAFSAYTKTRKSSRMTWGLKRDKNSCKTLIGKSKWKRPFGSYMRMKFKITALKTLGWNILVNDKT